MRLARDTSQTNELAVSLAALSWLESRTGQEEECRAHAEEALALCRSRDIHWGETWALFALGELELVLGNPAAAAGHLGELDRLLAELELGDPDISPGPELVEALARLGRPAEAAELAAAHLRAADGKGQPWARARARRCAGLLAEDGFDDAVPGGARAPRADARPLRDRPHRAGVRRPVAARGPAGRGA